MTEYKNLYWVAHQLGFAGDTVTTFFNLNVNRLNHWHHIHGRTRTAESGILLNWAWYYPKWYSTQKKDANLYKSLCLRPNQKQFSQAHFVNRENELLEKFPGSRVLTCLASNDEQARVYHKLAHRKLLDKKLFTSWYIRQQMNFPLKQDQNRRYADACFAKGMTVGQYRAIAHMDWLGLDKDKIPTDPMTFWQQQPYCANFLENLNTTLINNRTWFPYYDSQKQIPVYVDRLANIVTGKIDHDYYEELCQRLEIEPNHELFATFWTGWLSKQPSLDYQPNVSWSMLQS
jgi:hypothetical protein